MHIKFKVNKETLETVTEDQKVIIFINDNGNELIIEVSVPDPEEKVII